MVFEDEASVPKGKGGIKTSADEITVKEILLKFKKWVKFLKSKWLLILIMGFIGGGLGFVYACFQKTKYQAELTFSLQDEKSNSGLSSALGLASQFGINMGGSAGGEFSSDNLLLLIKSRSIIERSLLSPVIIKGKQETFAEYYIKVYDLRKSWDAHPRLKNIKFLPGSNRDAFTLEQDSVLKSIYKSISNNNLNIATVEKSNGIMRLRVTSIDESFSKLFVENLSKVVSDYYIQIKTEKALKNVKVLQKQTDSVRHELNSGISGVAVSMDANPNINPSRQVLRVPSQRRQIDVQANTAILGELVKNLELARMSLLQETPLIQIIDRPILPLDKERLGKIKGLILGGIISIFLTIMFISIRNILNTILEE